MRSRCLLGMVIEEALAGSLVMLDKSHVDVVAKEKMKYEVEGGCDLRGRKFVMFILGRIKTPTSA